MNLLAFETATPSGGVALLSDGAVVGECRLGEPRTHSREVLALAGKILEAAGLRWGDIDIYAASHGPGSFTGVRVALATIQGVAWAQGRPCVTVSTVEALAWQAWSGEAVEAVVPLLDARIGEIYGGVFVPEAGRLLRTEEDFAAAPGEVAAKWRGRRVLLAGEGARRYRDQFDWDGALLARADRLLAAPGATAVLAYRHAREGRTIAPGRVRAVYLREATTTRARPA